MKYQDKLNNCKESYPFDFWGEYYEQGGEYSPEVCEMMKNIFEL